MGGARPRRHRHRAVSGFQPVGSSPPRPVHPRGVFLWVCVLKSGIHATLAGVVVGIAVPLRTARAASPLMRLEHDLRPWVTFGVLPIFAFANAGVRLAGVTVAELLDPVELGIAFGLFLGKQLGIAGTIWAATRSGLATLPEGATGSRFTGCRC